MKTVKILLTGKDGQLGFELLRSLSVLGHVKALSKGDCNLCNENAVRRVIRDFRPDVIVNAAAYTAVDNAENEPAAAYLINAQAPTFLAEEAQALNAMIVHYSTDYVFAGDKQSGYLESDSPNPLGVYGSSKLEGELGVVQACVRHLILRTSWVAGAHGSNFAKTMLRLALQKDVVNVVADQWGSPTSAAFLADVTAHLVRQAVTQEFPYGLYHAAGKGKTNWHEYAVYVIEKARRAGWPIRVTPGSILAITTAEYPTLTKRPTNSYLDSTKLSEVFGLNVQKWEKGVDYIMSNILREPI